MAPIVGVPFVCPNKSLRDMLNMLTGGIPRMQANVSYWRTLLAVLRELCAMHDATARSQGSPASKRRSRPTIGGNSVQESYTSGSAHAPLKNLKPCALMESFELRGSPADWTGSK